MKLGSQRCSQLRLLSRPGQGPFIPLTAFNAFLFMNMHPKCGHCSFLLAITVALENSSMMLFPAWSSTRFCKTATEFEEFARADWGVSIRCHDVVSMLGVWVKRTGVATWARSSFKAISTTMAAGVFTHLAPKYECPSPPVCRTHTFLLRYLFFMHVHTRVPAPVVSPLMCTLLLLSQ